MTTNERKFIIEPDGDLAGLYRVYAEDIAR